MDGSKTGCALSGPCVLILRSSSMAFCNFLSGKVNQRTLDLNYQGAYRVIPRLNVFMLPDNFPIEENTKFICEEVKISILELCVFIGASSR
jgi:hypothetical protein